MEFRAAENEMRTSGSLSYSHLNKEGGERRRVSSSTHNGSSTGLTCTQTLDNYPRPPFQHHQPLHVPLSHGRDPDPDRVSTAGALPGTTTISQTGAGAKSKTTLLSTPTTASASSSSVRYRECLKNHAASAGGNVFDGCGEFMPSGEEGSLEALKCAACHCHRNFHRKEVDGESHHQLMYSPSGSSRSRSSGLMLNPLQLPPPLPSPSALHPHHHHSHHHKFFNHAPIIQPMNVAFGGGGTESSSEDLNVYNNNNNNNNNHQYSTAEGAAATPYSMSSKKRYRTKFTQEQKDKMLEFAEKVGWRFQKQDDDEVERFCAEIGVKRQVLKVWMHNNKSTVKKQQQENENMMLVSSNISNIQSLEVSTTAGHHDNDPVEEDDGGLDT